MDSGTSPFPPTPKCSQLHTMGHWEQHLPHAGSSGDGGSQAPGAHHSLVHESSTSQYSHRNAGSGLLAIHILRADPTDTGCTAGQHHVLASKAGGKACLSPLLVRTSLHSPDPVGVPSRWDEEAGSSGPPVLSCGIVRVRRYCDIDPIN
jgi:hypothetical protein